MPATMAAPDLAPWRARAEAALEHALPDPATAPQRLHAAMRHGVLNGGKRMRPLLVYATGTAFGADEDTLDAAARREEIARMLSGATITDEARAAARALIG